MGALLCRMNTIADQFILFVIALGSIVNSLYIEDWRCGSFLTLIRDQISWDNRQADIERDEVEWRTEIDQQT